MGCGSSVKKVQPNDGGPKAPEATSTACGSTKKVAEDAGTLNATLEDRLRNLEDANLQQAAQIRYLEQALCTVQKDCRRTVSVAQYNILASYLGKNTQPWFLYGVDISVDERSVIMKRYLAKDEAGKPMYPWPKYVEGVLSKADIAAVEAKDENFKWEKRGERLVKTIMDLDADIISLVENDQHAFFSEALSGVWDSTFHKRPRENSLDGCGVFWRQSKFDLVDSMGVDFVDSQRECGTLVRDRSCLLALLNFKVDGAPLVILSTHLAKNPEDSGQTALRVRQVSQLLEALTNFTEEHNCGDAPVILMGDLNAKHFGEIRGIARTVWQIKGSPVHQFLWSACDVATGPTSITKARQCRIDAVQYTKTHLEVLEVRPVPKLPSGEVIPNEVHPSDHLPVCVRFLVKDGHKKDMECARLWFECVAGQEKVYPLTENELRTAFDYFDRNRKGSVCRWDIEEACLDLAVNFHGDAQKLLMNCFPDHVISYHHFVAAYEMRLNHERMRFVGELESAFRYLSGGSDSVALKDLQAAFREITPISFSDQEVAQMIARLNVQEGQTIVSLHEFCAVVCETTLPHRSDRRLHSVNPEHKRAHCERSISKCGTTAQLEHGLSNLHHYVSWRKADIGTVSQGGTLHVPAVKAAG